MIVASVDLLALDVAVARVRDQGMLLGAALGVVVGEDERRTRKVMIALSQ